MISCDDCRGPGSVGLSSCKAKCLATDEMTFGVEGVVNGGVGSEKPLR